MKIPKVTHFNNVWPVHLWCVREQATEKKEKMMENEEEKNGMFSIVPSSF